MLIHKDLSIEKGDRIEFGGCVNGRIFAPGGKIGKVGIFRICFINTSVGSSKQTVFIIHYHAKYINLAAILPYVVSFTNLLFLNIEDHNPESA